MSTISHSRRRDRKSAGAAKLGFALVLLGLAGLAAVIFAYRLDWLTVREAFGYVEWLVYFSAAVAALGLLGVIQAIRNGRPGAIVLAGVTLVVALAMVWIPYRGRAALRASPPLSDITTDIRNPPVFGKLKMLRKAAKARNTMAYDKKKAALQRRYYPDIKPVILKIPTGEAFERALAAVRKAGLTIVTADKLIGSIEAYDTSLLFGFVDDVVIRVWKEDTGSRVDIRSSSRVGRRDARVNADRVRMLMRAIAKP